MTRSLLLKGLAGVAALGGAVGGGFVAVNSGLLGGGKVKEQESKDLSNFTHKELIEKVGLSCGLSGDDIGEETKDCTVKDNGSINVRLGDQEEEGVTFTNGGSSKLKVSKSEGYSRDLKFVVDSGDISLSKKDGGGTATTIQKLEQFETYEVFLREDGKFFLSRKTDAKEEKIKALGLPSSCSLLDTGTSECSLTTQEDIKAVKFVKQTTEEITLSSGTVTLKISKMGDSDSDFGENKYRFTFTFPSDQTINTKKVKANTSYDFKIKKAETGNTLTLERAWSEDKDFAKKAGLKCESNNGCTVPAESQKLNVKVGDKKKEDITNITGTGKIKMEKEQAGYNQGLKFTITTADVTLTGGTSPAGSEDISKLEELETYEITEGGGKYYLTRKTSKDDGIKSSLVLPQGCDLPTSSTENKTCSLDEAKFKAINFDGKGDSTTGSGTLTISKATNTTDFPLGYRFTFNTTTEATIKTGNTIKANIPTDFKIKKEEGKALSLEKAWDNYSLAAKVGLTCSSASGGEECCTKTGSEKLNVKKGTDKKEGITGFNGSSGKIKVEKDQAGYNQGLKFTITTADVTLNDGTDVSGTISKLEELETYEITEEGGKYYLTRKDEASKNIISLLGLPEKCKVSSNSCSLNTQEIKSIKFEDKEASGATMSSGTATLTITSGADTSEFPLGYKFTLQSTNSDITIKSGQDNNNVVKKNTSYDFKIKKETNNPTSLTLEKAWTADSLAKKVGLKCCDDKTNECSIQDSGGQLKVKQINKNKDTLKETALSKSNGSSSGKIKVEKDQEGYNQGFKFTISDGSIGLTGSKKSEENEKITSFGEFETYEIKEEGSEGWFFVRKNRADVFIKQQLKIGSFCSGSFPDTTGAPETCNIEDPNKLKDVNFDNKSGFTSWPTSKNIQLEINKDTSLPGGFKFTFNSCDDTSTCLPGSTNAKTDTSGGLMYRIKKNASAGTISLEPMPKS